MGLRMLIAGITPAPDCESPHIDVDHPQNVRADRQSACHHRERQGGASARDARRACEVLPGGPTEGEAATGDSDVTL